MGDERTRFVPMDGAISAPKFSSDAYEEYRRNVRFWEGVNGYFEEGQIVAKLAMRAEGVLKIIIIRYLKEVKEAATR